MLLSPRKPILFAAGATLGLATVFVIFFQAHFGSSVCRKHQSNAEAQIVADVLAQSPSPLIVSPQGALLLAKNRFEAAFELEVIELSSTKVVAHCLSSDTQLSPAWRPDEKAIAYFAARAGNGIYYLYVWDLPTSRVSVLDTPPTASPIPRSRWSPDGTKIAYLVGHGGEEGSLWVVDFATHGQGRLVIGGIREKSDFQWSADGKHLAVVKVQSPDLLTVVDAETHDVVFQVGQAGLRDIREFVWSPLNDAIVLTARSNEFLRLFRFDIKTNQLTRCITELGDVIEPHYGGVDRIVLYELSKDSKLRLFATHCRGDAASAIGPSTGFTRYLGWASQNSLVIGLHTSPTEPPAVFEYTRNSLSSKLVFSPPHAGELRSTAATFLRLQAADGISIPAVLWPHQGAGPAKAVLVVVHGGPHLEEFVRWEILPRLANARGFDVLAVNYRGSSGSGETFENAGNAAQRATDVLAGCEYAHRNLHVSRNQVVLLGISYGAYVTALAASVKPSQIGGAVLVSMIRTNWPSEKAGPPNFPVVVFQGANDPGTTPREARETLEARLGPDVFANPNAFRVLPEEGHVFARTDSWAQVYMEVLNLLSRVSR